MQFYLLCKTQGDKKYRYLVINKYRNNYGHFCPKYLKNGAVSPPTSKLSNLPKFSINQILRPGIDYYVAHLRLYLFNILQ